MKGGRWLTPKGEKPLMRPDLQPAGRSLESTPYEVQAVREIRCMLLIIEPGSNMDGSPTFYFTLLRCVNGQVRWHRALRLWRHWDGGLFLVSDPGDPGAETEFFVIEQGIRPAERPWASEVDRDFGLRHADAMLLAP